MASALDTIAHVVLPNLMKLKGASTLVGAMERRDASPFAQVWQQTGVNHNPFVAAKERGDWRFGVMTLSIECRAAWYSGVRPCWSRAFGSAPRSNSSRTILGHW